MGCQAQSVLGLWAPGDKRNSPWSGFELNASSSLEQAKGLWLGSFPGEVVNTHGPVEPDKDHVRQEPYTLPQGFTWDALDLGDRGVVSRPSSRCCLGLPWTL